MPEWLPQINVQTSPGRVRNPTESLPLLSASGRPPRKLNNLNSVILAISGKKVQRTDLFFNSEFESFNDDTINDSEALESLRSVAGSISHGRIMRERARSLWQRLCSLLVGEAFKNVLKCAMAYLLASLGVYLTPFNNFLGDTDSKHVAATAAVYFHPARTLGSMHQLFMFVFISLAFSFLLSITSRSILSFFFNVGEDEISYAIDLVMLSVGLGVIAFMKQKVNKETFNTACSLASISIVTCIVKEGSLHSNAIPMNRLLSTSKVTLVGSSISIAVCYLLWPRSAVGSLRASLNDSFNIMSSLLSVVTHRFINGKKLSAKDAEVFLLLRKKANELSKNLEEAKYELLLVGKESEYEAYREIVEATISLQEHLHALRASCEMQWQLLQEGLQTEPLGDVEDTDSFQSLDSYHADTLPVSHSVENMNAINTHHNTLNSEMIYSAVYSSQLFDLFVYYLAPSIKSFVFTVKEVLAATPFEHDIDGNKHHNFFVKLTNFQLSLTKAIELFELKQVSSFDKLYAQKIFKSTDYNFKTDQEAVTACCGNFAYLLSLYGKLLIHFLQLTEDFDVMAVRRRRSWNWVKDLFKYGSLTQSELTGATFMDALRELKSQLKPGLNLPGDSPPSKKTKLEKFRMNLWRSLSVFRRTDVQFGIRVGVGAFCISVFAFLSRTQNFFITYRLEWSLAIYCIMMNKSLGGTNMTAKWRFIGTFLGVFLAYLAWQISDANPYALAFTGFLLSIPCFYIIVYGKNNNAYGRFILLAYNLTALYSYSMLQKDSEDDYEGGDLPLVLEIAVHRFLAVSLGVIWALVLSTTFLPNSARVRLKSGLTILWLRMGIVWNSDPLDYEMTPAGARLVGVKSYKDTRKLFLECQLLMKQAPIEFRLKGRFPKETYEKLLRSTSLILDAFLNLQFLIDVDCSLLPNEEYVLQYIESEREELEQRIFLIFYVVASALALGFPLPKKPASTEHAKDRLLFKLSEVRLESNAERVVLTNQDYVLFYSYILVTSTITNELDKILENLKELLGDFSEDIFTLV